MACNPFGFDVAAHENLSARIRRLRDEHRLGHPLRKRGLVESHTGIKLQHVMWKLLIHVERSKLERLECGVTRAVQIADLHQCWRQRDRKGQSECPQRHQMPRVPRDLPPFPPGSLGVSVPTNPVYLNVGVRSLVGNT